MNSIQQLWFSKLPDCSVKVFFQSGRGLPWISPPPFLLALCSTATQATLLLISQCLKCLKCASYVLTTLCTLSSAAVASWVADLTSSPLTDRIWSPCISRPSVSAKPPLTISDTNTPVSFLTGTQTWRRDDFRVMQFSSLLADHKSALLLSI